jgi:hypothetical protein
MASFVDNSGEPDNGHWLPIFGSFHSRHRSCLGVPIVHDFVVHFRGFTGNKESVGEASRHP